MPEGADRDEAWAEIENGSDRVSALLVAAWLDISLEEVLRQNFGSNYPKDDKSIFEADGAPLRPFAAKVNMAYALGVFGDVTRNAILDISRIRNAFAHSPLNVTFETPEISEACKRIPDTHSLYKDVFDDGDAILPKDNTAREHFLDSSLDIMYVLSKYSTWWHNKQISVYSLRIELANLTINISQDGINDLYRAILKSQIDAINQRLGVSAPVIP